MWVVFSGAALLIALTPGANNIVGLHHGVHHGARRAVFALAGRLTAFAVMIGAVIAGLGPLLAASETALTVIKYAGVAYLLLLGGRLLRTTLRRGAVAPAEVPPAPGSTLLRKEFVVAITNPKAVLVFTAFVPQFIDPALGNVALQLAVLGAIYLAMELVAGTVYCVGGAMIGTAGLGARARKRLDRGTGVVLLGMAGALAASHT
jgi:threonine/homoserine/homoserine lactone efflux protein